MRCDKKKFSSDSIFVYGGSENMIIYYFSIQGQCLPNGLYLNNLAISNLDDNMPGVLKNFVMELFLCHKIECLKIKDCRVKMAKTGSTKLFLVL